MLLPSQPARDALVGSTYLRSCSGDTARPGMGEGMWVAPVRREVEQAEAPLPLTREGGLCARDFVDQSGVAIIRLGSQVDIHGTKMIRSRKMIIA
jgi:hypothetical protein